MIFYPGETTTKRILIMIILVISFIGVGFPLMYLISLSLSSFENTFQITIFPKDFIWKNYQEAWQTARIGLYYKNSFIVSLFAILINLFSSSLAAYAFARFQFPFKEQIFYLFLITLILPGIAALIPLFLDLKALGLIDTRTGLILVYSSTTLAFSIFILRGFFETLPKELEEAARLDGAGDFYIFFKIMLPISKPSIATVAIFQFIQYWDELIMAITFISSEGKKTLPAGLINLQGQYWTNYPVLAAGMVLSIIPVCIVYVLLQRHIEKALTFGALKG